MNTLQNINNWKSELGLFPTKFNPSLIDEKYVMLNGGNGDFCIQTCQSKEEKEVFYSDAWSTNTKNYVLVDNQNIKLYNWLKKTEEPIQLKDIENSKEKFYKYLVTKSYKTENDLVPFLINIFRQLRNITQEKHNPVASLGLLYQLLISLKEDYTSINYQKWGIDKIDIPTNFEYYVDLLKVGVQKIAPNLDLLLRHSSSALFQEAHREVVYFNPQLDIFSGISSKQLFKPDSYSSIHYTPPFLARSIVENSLKNIDLKKQILKIFDPACGSSEFLIEALKQLKNLQFDGKVIIIGWDSSESAINTSKFLLQYEKNTQWGYNLEFNVKNVKDSINEIWEKDIDLILMNPPFSSYELIKTKEEKDNLMNVFEKDLKIVKPNQASGFFYNAIKSLNESGVIGCVLPSSIFTFESYKYLRNVINEQLALKLVAKLGNFVFEDALTDVSFFIGQKPKSKSIPKLIWCKNEKGVIQDVLRDFRKMEANNELSKDEKNFNIYIPNHFPLIKDTWRIISLNESKLIKDLDRFTKDGFLTKVSDIFRVQQGIRTGNNDAFLINTEQFYKIPLLERVYYRKVVVNNSIKNGCLKLLNYVWYPYDNLDLIIKDELFFINNAPYSYNILSQFKPNLINRPRISKETWWQLSEHRAWLREINKRLYSTEFGKSDSFAFDTEGDFVVERGNGWIPNKELETDDYYFYLSIFSSNIFDILLSIYSKQLAGGKWFDLGAKYTSNIPIPNVHKAEVKNHLAYNQLVEYGKELSNGNSYIKSAIDDVLKKSFYTMIK